jgi:hypothetical protein
MPAFPLIAGQRGLATRAQLRAAGWSDGAIRHLAEVSGQRPFPGVFAAHRGRLSHEELLVGASLWAGAHAAMTGAHALRLLGADVPRLPTTVRFLIPDGLYVPAAPGAEVRRTTRFPRTRTVGGLRVVSLERALCDASRYRELGPAASEALTISSLQRLLTTPARLAAELAGGRRNGSAAVRAGLAEFRRGAWSPAEVALRRCLAARPWRFVTNVRLLDDEGRYVGTPDAYLPDAGLVVQVHSRRYHSGRDDAGHDLWQQTVEADSRYAAVGIVPIGVAPSTLTSAPGRFLATLDAAVAARAGIPSPAVTMEPARRAPEDLAG